MLIHKKFLIRAAAFLAVASFVPLLVLGCGDDEFSKRYPVTGTVTYNGKPVEKAQITFNPTWAPRTM